MGELVVAPAARIFTAVARDDDYAKLRAYGSGEVVRTYDERWSGARGARRDARKARAIQRALARLAAEVGAPLRSVLDLPCGTGRFTGLLSARAAYLGADLSREMLAAARRKFPGAGLIVADSAALPLATDAIDVALCIRFLHLVRSRELRVAFVRELARVSRFGVIVDYRHGHTLRVVGRRLRFRLGLRERPPSNPSPAAIGREIQDAGLVEIARIAVHRAPFLSDKVLVVARKRP